MHLITQNYAIRSAGFKNYTFKGLKKGVNVSVENKRLTADDCGLCVTFS